MQPEVQWFLYGLAPAIIFFILNKTMKTLPRWSIITGYAGAIYFALLGLLATFNLLQSLYVIALTCIIVLAIFVIIDIPIMRKVEIVKTPASWLLQVLDNDLKKISSRIFWREYRWSVDGLTKTDPYFDLTVTMINANIYNIKIEKVRGRFLIEGQECAQVAELLSATGIPHGESGNITIRQRISGEMKKFMIKQGYSQDTLSVSVAPCDILIQPWVQGGKPSWVSIGNEFTIPTKHFPS